MIGRGSHYLCVFIACSCVNLATAQVDPDLDLLPGDLDEGGITTSEGQQSTVSITDSVNTRSLLSNIDLWVDNTFTVIDWRDENDLIVSLPDDNRADWANLLRMNGRVNLRLSPSLEGNFETTLNVFSREGDSFKASDDFRLDIEEAYLSWRRSPTLFLDIGRINIRNGVATGFNPTDYFRVNSVVTRTTADVSQLRDNRLGALSSRAQKVWNGGSLTFVAAPDVGDKEQRWYTDHDIYGLHLNDTNGKTRFMLALTHELADGFSPELLYLNESGQHNLGLNFSYTLTEKTVLYAEWNIGERRSLADEALYESSTTAPLHPVLTQAFPDKGESFFNQSALGFAYTSESNITTNVEYHYNEAGFSDNDWDAYFEAGAAANGNTAILGPLLSIRGLARNRIEPVSEHTMMLRSTWTDIIPDFSATGLLFFDLVDNSYLAQLEAAWNINHSSSLVARIARLDGNNDSNYGSQERETTFNLQLNYYF